MRSERAHCAVRLHGTGAAAGPLHDWGNRPGWRRSRDRNRCAPAVPPPAAAARHGTPVGAGAATSAVFMIGYLAPLLGEDGNWAFDLSINMFPEGGCLCVCGIGEDGAPAFTRNGIENLRQIIAD